MWEKARMSRIFCFVCIILAEGSAIGHTVFMAYTAYTANLDPESIQNAEFPKPLYFMGKFPYNTQISPSYEITWILQMIAGFLAATAYAAVDGIFVTLTLHLCGQLINLQISTRKIGQSNGVNDLEVLRSLSNIVKKHRKISEFATAIEDTLNVMFLVQMMAPAVTFILQGYQLVMITTSKDTDIPLYELIFMVYYTMTVNFSLFIYCYVAEILRTKSMKVGNAVYESNWYNLPPAKIKFLIFIMIRARQPFILSILKSSGGYLSVLLAMKDRLVS